METEVFKEFRFEAAHQLTHLPPSHKCYRLHGHSYRVRVFVAGLVCPETGFVVDFAEIKEAMTPVLERLDHRLLNDIEDMSHPTTENLAAWIWGQLKPSLGGLSKIEIWETATCGCVYRGGEE